MLVVLAQIRSRSLHSFCNASTKIWGSCTVFSDTTTEVGIIMAKSKVSPHKTQSIARLELCGAQLLSKLLSQVSLDLSNLYMHGLTHLSSSWMVEDSSQLSISHRVTDITTKLAADMLVLTLIQLTWCLDEFFPQIYCRISGSAMAVSAPTHQILTKKNLSWRTQCTLEFENQCSSFSRLCRVTAWILCFVAKTKGQQQEFPPYLSIQVLCTAKTTVIRASQRHTYSAESHALQKGQALPMSSTLSSIVPYLNSDGLMRIRETSET